jgi:Bacterial PH domain/Short C-terminal domain
MSYADGLLSTGERIIYRNKQHPFIFIWGARWTILAVVGAVVLFWLGGNLAPDGISGSLRQILGWITAILFFGGLVVFGWTALRYINQEYVLTNRRVIQVEGVLNRSATDSSLEKINDALLSQSVFGRMFDFGDLTVLTASEGGIERMHMIRSPIVYKKKMLDAKHEYEVDMERSGWAPSPPIRDAATAGGPTAPGAEVGATVAPAAPAQAPAAAAPAADPDDVTRTLASLADLRDRGAISPEEYERKKAELLSRI